jgi:competence protein CoiA
MKFALIDGVRKEAEPTLKGICIGCGNQTLARCGEIRANHWAHKGVRRCDPWWENETDWHRAWKNEFPNDWQEVVHSAENGEKHIADVKTEGGWVLEFQHSHIKPEERRSREEFYEKLIWVVDGTRRIKDKKRFFEILGEERHSKKYPDLRSTFPEGALFRDWIHSRTHVLIDFDEEDLWWLLPQSNDYYALVIPMTRRQFIDLHRTSSSSSEDGFGLFYKKYDLKVPEPPAQNPRTVAASDEASIHPNSILRLVNHQRRFRL